MNRQLGTWTARAIPGNVGSMHAIGTQVDLDGVTVCPYRLNEAVPRKLLRNLFCAFSTIGEHFFSEIVAVTMDTKHIYGLEHHVRPMEDDVDGHRVGYTIDMSVNQGN